MNCGSCTHWDLRHSPLRQEGYGLCKVEPEERMRGARTYSAMNVCRFETFKQAPAATVARRQLEAQRTANARPA